MKKRGQAAIEFLTTYGWAILILIIVIAAIGALGVFSPKAPNKCDATSPIFCSDIKLDTNGVITLSLTASGTSTKSGLETKVISITLDTPITASCTPSPNIVFTDQYTTLNCDATSTTLSKGNRFTGNAKVEYYLRETESAPVKHTTKVIFSGTIEEP